MSIEQSPSIKIIVPEDRMKFLEFLLLADESEEIVLEYIHQGDLYEILYNTVTVGVLLFIPTNNTIIEIKNIAISPEYQGLGIGKQVLNESYNLYRNKGYAKIILGTANSSIENIAFYQKAGFRMTEIKRGFFEKYPEHIYENGIRALDMIMFEKSLTNYIT